MWNSTLDESVRVKLRFKIDDRVRVVDGPEKGQRARVTALALRYAKPYVLELDGGATGYAADNERDRDSQE